MKPISLEHALWRDERGWGINPFKIAGLDGKPVYDFHTVSIEPGMIRGNHYHVGATEWLLIFGGTALLAWTMNTDQAAEQIRLQSDEPMLFEFPPGVAHAVKNISSHTIYLLSFSNSPDRETIRIPSII